MEDLANLRWRERRWMLKAGCCGDVAVAIHQCAMDSLPLHTGQGWRRRWGRLATVLVRKDTTRTDFALLTDEQWTTQLAASPPAEVPWMSDLVSR